MKYCFGCDRGNDNDALVCSFCGHNSFYLMLKNDFKTVITLAKKLEGGGRE